jgi:4-amino-4-deoxy-L-arabinose transferase-like glycosyltransferase
MAPLSGKDRYEQRLIASALVGVVLVRFLLLPLYPVLDKSESRYATVAMWMAEKNDWITPTMDGVTPFWAKPPLAFWLSAASIEVFGLNELAVRLPDFLIYLAIAGMVFLLGRDARGRTFGMLAACAYLSMGLAFFLAGSVMTDPALALCTTLALSAFWFAMTREGRLSGYLMFLAFGLSLLAKGPIGVLLPLASMVAWSVWIGRPGDLWRRLPVVSGSVLMLAIALPWYVLAELKTPGFLHYFIVGEHFMRYIDPGWTGDLYGAARHKPLGASWFFAFVATLPWSPVAVWALVRRHIGVKTDWSRLGDPWFRFLLAWSLVPLVFFTLARNTLISYVLPSMPALALLTAHLLRRMKWSNYPVTFRLASGGSALLGCAVVGANLLFPNSEREPSQEAVVEYWRSEPERTDDEPLVFVYEKPSSADFYTHGTAREVTAEKAVELIATHRSHTLAVLDERVHDLPPALRARLKEVQRRNGTVLFVAKELATARPRAAEASDSTVAVRPGESPRR